MEYNDFLDTDIPYDEIPNHLPQPTTSRTPANVDAGSQLQQTITGAFRRAASPPNTYEYQARATETFESTIAYIQRLANDHEALQKRCENLLALAKSKGLARAAERLEQIQQGESAEIGQRVVVFLERMNEIERLFTRGKYKAVYYRSGAVCDEYGSSGVRQQMDRLQEVVDELAEVF